MYARGGNFISQATTPWLTNKYNDAIISTQSGKHQGQDHATSHSMLLSYSQYYTVKV